MWRARHYRTGDLVLMPSKGEQIHEASGYPRCHSNSHRNERCGSAGAAAERCRNSTKGVAQQCLNDLRAFGQRMDKDGFRLNGYGHRWAYSYPPSVVTPWGALTEFGINSPRFQIHALYGAASVLARRGNEQACQAVLAELGAVYGQRVAQLRQAGIEPGQVISWRQRLILAAQPVTQFGRALSIDDLFGVDVRNPRTSGSAASTT